MTHPCRFRRTRAQVHVLEGTDSHLQHEVAALKQIIQDASATSSSKRRGGGGGGGEDREDGGEDRAVVSPDIQLLKVQL